MKERDDAPLPLDAANAPATRPSLCRWVVYTDPTGQELAAVVSLVHDATAGRVGLHVCVPPTTLGAALQVFAGGSIMEYAEAGYDPAGAKGSWRWPPRT